MDYKNNSRDGAYLHLVLQYQYEPHPLHLLSGRFSFDRRKQASHRRPFSEPRRIVAKPKVKRRDDPARNDVVEIALSRAMGCGTSLSKPDCEYNSVIESQKNRYKHSLHRDPDRTDAGLINILDTNTYMLYFM